jgi:hypothetical protein
MSKSNIYSVHIYTQDKKTVYFQYFSSLIKCERCLNEFSERQDEILCVLYENIYNGTITELSSNLIAYMFEIKKITVI